VIPIFAVSSDFCNAVREMVLAAVRAEVCRAFTIVLPVVERRGQQAGKQRRREHNHACKRNRSRLLPVEPTTQPTEIVRQNSKPEYLDEGRQGG
jgi:hypothetical protein